MQFISTEAAIRQNTFKKIIESISDFSPESKAALTAVSAETHENKFSRKDVISFATPLSLNADFVTVPYVTEAGKNRLKMIRSENMRLACVIGNRFDSNEFSATISLFGYDSTGAMHIWKLLDAGFDHKEVNSTVNELLKDYGPAQDTSSISKILEAFNSTLSLQAA